MNDNINHPKHYTSHPSGIECIQITRHMNFNLGNVVKYLWRTDHKNGLEDLKKARWYLDDEIARLEKATPCMTSSETSASLADVEGEVMTSIIRTCDRELLGQYMLPKYFDGKTLGDLPTDILAKLLAEGYGGDTEIATYHSSPE